MAFVRWSSDDGRSDVYCYENVSGAWTTHVAGQKPIGMETRPPDPSLELLKSDPERWQREQKALEDWYKDREYEPIGLPHDGETFDDAGPQEMLDRLRHLKSIGYHVPDYVFDVLAEEVRDAQSENTDGR